MAEERCLGELLGGGPLAGVHAQARGHEAHRVLTPAARVRYMDILQYYYIRALSDRAKVFLYMTSKPRKGSIIISEKNMLDV